MSRTTSDGAGRFTRDVQRRVPVPAAAAQPFDDSPHWVAIDRLAAVPTDPGFVLFEVPLLRLRALLARAHHDAEAYKQFRDRYRDRAKTVGFEGHIALAEAMP